MSTRRRMFRAMLAAVATLPVVAWAEGEGGDKNDGRGSQGYNDRGYGYGTSRSRNSGGYSDGGASVRQSAGCLLKGTKVSTPAGERPVEYLKIGDKVLTLSGPKSIKWIGRDRFTKSGDRPWHDSVMPICFVRSALDDRSPKRELYLSPLHCVFINGALIPAKYLVNRISIIRGAPAGTSAIEYYHIDLGTHEVICAEGAPVESFFDGVEGREFFANFVQYERLYGAEPPKMKRFAPILDRNRPQRITAGMRAFVSNVVDVRDPIQVAHDQIARRAEALLV